MLVGSWPVDDSTFFGPALLGEVVGDAAGLAGIVHELADVLSTTWEHDAGQRFRRAALAELTAAVPAASGALTPLEVVRIARAVAPASTVATVDAGAHMLLTVPFWEVDEPGTLLISNGLATMGFALPAAIAAALVEPDRHVVCFTGDGGLGMTLAELETLARLDLPVVVVVFNDSTLSLIAAKQSPQGHGGDDAVRYRITDFAAIARGCGMWADSVDDVETFDRVDPRHARASWSDVARRGRRPVGIRRRARRGARSASLRQGLVVVEPRGPQHVEVAGEHLVPACQHGIEIIVHREVAPREAVAIADGQPHDQLDRIRRQSTSPLAELVERPVRGYGARDGRWARGR